MKAMTILLIVAGILGLIASAVFPVLVGIPGLTGSIAMLLTGIGFFLRCCAPWRK